MDGRPAAEARRAVPPGEDSAGAASVKALKIAAAVSALYVGATGYVLYRLLMSHPYR